MAPHYRSAPDGNFYNNWSTVGNVNPYTGAPGTKSYPSPSYGSDVYVHGYWRSDGTYVPPHYRSAPDGNPYNNWSTVGNVNPYTGEAGTKTPPAYSPEVADREMRIREAQDLAGLGLNVNWQDHSFSQMYDWETRIKEAQDLRGLGLDVRWQDHSFSEMYDWETRIKEAHDLQNLGLNVDWQTNSFSQMYDWELRIKEAQDLAQLGVNVDWRQHSFSELFQMENAARAAAK